MYEWHMALHQVTGSMTLVWTRASADDLRQWALELRAVAAAMEAAASIRQPLEEPKTSDTIPDWILEVIDK
jgi:hypothetical protein